MEAGVREGTWATTEEEVAEADPQEDRGRMDTGAFAEEEVHGREEGRSMGADWAMEACRAGSGGGENGFPMGRVGGAMAGDGGEATESENPLAPASLYLRDPNRNSKILD